MPEEPSSAARPVPPSSWPEADDLPRIPALIAVAVGNTRTRIGVFKEGELREAESVMNDADPGRAARAFIERTGAEGSAAVLSAVHPGFADAVADGIDPVTTDVHRLGRDLPIRIAHGLDDAGTVGHDRLVNAIGAYGRARQACVVIDLGTAMTVDFVDGRGTFQGGAIMPGLRMMLRALHEQTAQLPLLTYERPDPARGPIGKDTPHAMRLGVTAMVRGAVRELVEQYAEFYEAYPQVVATGGDAGVLEAQGESGLGAGVIEHFVPDLQLIGIYTACQLALHEGDEDEL